MALAVNVSTRDGPGPKATVVRIVGQLEADTEADARKRLEPLQSAPPAVLILDLADLEFISSLGLGVLLQFCRGLMKGGSSVYAVNARHRIQRVMDVVPILPADRMFKTTADLDARLAAGT